MTKKKGLTQRLAEGMDIPGDVLPGVPRVTITGSTRVLVENHKGLLEYGRELIEINGGRMRLRISGAGLELECMTRSDLSIKGVIASVEFE